MDRKRLLGKAPNSTYTRRMLQSDLEAAEIPYEDNGRYADFHSLRHTFVSNLASSGVHPSVAQSLARHSTITLTMNVYTHTIQTVEIDAIGQLPDLSQRSADRKNKGAV